MYDKFRIFVDKMDYIAHYDSPLGGITLACNGAALVGLWFDGQKHFASTLGEEVRESHAYMPVMTDAFRWLDEYFSGRIPDTTPPVALEVSEFRSSVLEALMTVAYGRIVSYGELANMVARRSGRNVVSARAVGGAVSHNPISLIIPCHRVVGASGTLTGYAGGIERKRYLLEMEQSVAASMKPLSCNE